MLLINIEFDTVLINITYVHEYLFAVQLYARVIHEYLFALKFYARVNKVNSASFVIYFV